MKALSDQGVPVPKMLGLCEEARYANSYTRGSHGSQARDNCRLGMGKWLGRGKWSFLNDGLFWGIAEVGLDWGWVEDAAV